MSIIRVVVADDQDLIRTGLAMILGAQPDLEVVGEAADGLSRLGDSTAPDVLLVDIPMPGLKDAGPELLVQAIHAAADGDALVAPNITRRLLATFADHASVAAVSPSTRSLSARKRCWRWWRWVAPVPRSPPSSSSA